MFRGEYPDSEEATTIDRYMVLHADHGLNASTFSARVTASTWSDIFSSVLSAIGTLKGPLHGGASERVMLMLDSINHLHEVNEYITGLLDDKRRIMGFGHRVYRAEDPRAKHLRQMSQLLLEKTGEKRLYQKFMKIEETVKLKKNIYPNVDFYAASVMHALKIPREYFTAFFASSRISGWTAHIVEQYRDNKLIRPTSKYIGHYGRPFVAISER
jgi:citrate synthase